MLFLFLEIFLEVPVSNRQLLGHISAKWLFQYLKILKNKESS